MSADATQTTLAQQLLDAFPGRADVFASAHGSSFQPTQRAITLADVERHVNQHACAGFYLLRADNTVFCSAADFDGRHESDWRERAEKTAEWLRSADLEPLIEVSQSGNGAHVWLLFAEPIAAWLVRAFWRFALKRAGVACREIFPKQDELTGKGVGNLLRLPLWNRSRFVDAEWNALPAEDALADLRRHTQDELVEIATRAGVVLQRDAPKPAESTGTASLDDLPAGTRWKLRALITALDGVEVGDRSEADFAVVGELHRAGLTAAAAFGLVRDRSKFAERGETYFRTAWDKTAGNNGKASHDGAPVPILTRLADVAPVPVRWLWPGRIALGKVTLLPGDPGLGKSFVTLDIAARKSAGASWPDRPSERIDPGGVVILSAEDDAADTIRPRLDAAKADVDRIVLLSAVQSGERSRSFNLADDLPALEAAISQTPDCRLVIVDPISAYLGTGVDSHRNSDIRGMLAPLSELAARCGVAVLAVTHLRKGDGKAVYRAMGSLAFVAAARAVWGVERDRNDPGGRRRLLLPIKNNLAAR